jgi:hypothetical protein
MLVNKKGESRTSGDLIVKIAKHLQREQRRLEKELVQKEERDREVRVAFSELPFAPFWKKLFIPLLKWFLVSEANRLEKEIPILKEKTERYRQAIINLEQGIYESVTPVLKELGEAWSIREDIIISKLGVADTKYKEILDLTEQLRVLQKE